MLKAKKTPSFNPGRLGDQNEEFIDVLLTMRDLFVAPPGKSFASADFKNQEMYIAAVNSKDPLMLGVFSAPPFITFEGKNYVNPDADMHTLTTATCCFPELFRGKPKHLWREIADDGSLISQKGNARDYGKRTGFGIIYMQTSQAMSELNYLPEPTCKLWIERHKETYSKFHQWAQEVGAMSSARGFSTDSIGRVRFVNEDNAKGSGASPMRSAVNFCIQGAAASMKKIACIKAQERFLGTKAFLIGEVHDELLAEVPGESTIDWDNSTVDDDGVTNLKFIVSDEALFWGEELKNCLIDAEYEFFRRKYPGLADVHVAPFWNH